MCRRKNEGPLGQREPCHTILKWENPPDSRSHRRDMGGVDYLRSFFCSQSLPSTKRETM